MSIRVLVVDDQALVRGGFAMVLDHQPDVEVVAEAGTGLEAVDAARRHRPDVVLMDIRMPELDGLQATERIVAELGGAARVLILTTFEPDEYVYRALRAGASGFVLKDIPPEQLVVAVRAVAQGGALLAPSITRRLIGRFCGAAQRRRRPRRPARAADGPRARRRRRRGSRPQQPPDRRRAVHRGRDGDVARVERAGRAGPSRPRPADRLLRASHGRCRRAVAESVRAPARPAFPSDRRCSSGVSDE